MFKTGRHSSKIASLLADYLVEGVFFCTFMEIWTVLLCAVNLRQVGVAVSGMKRLVRRKEGAERRGGEEKRGIPLRSS